MARFSLHADWLPLIEVSGPFLTTSVLDRVFPQGLDALYPETKKHLRLAYNSWRNNLEQQDVQMPALHRAWCDIVLTELLDFEKNDLKDGKSWTTSNDTGTQSFSPTYAITDGVDTVGNPLMFVLIIPPETKLNAMDR